MDAFKMLMKKVNKNFVTKFGENNVLGQVVCLDESESPYKNETEM